MLQTLADAKAYATDRIPLLQKRELAIEEKFYIENLLEDIFMERISELVSDEELANMPASTIEELEGHLFYHLPNYVTLLEETTAEFVASYVLEDYDDEDDTDLAEQEKNEPAETVEKAE
jgi:hypothetical protein